MKSTNQTILVVDDDRLNINILVALLENEFTIIVAKSGHQALKRVQDAVLPDLILLDVMMPGMNGFEVLTQLQADETTRHIPVIFVTAMGQIEDETRGFSLGAVDYIHKPISPSVVKARVRTHLALRQAYQQLEEQTNRLLCERSLIENTILRMRQASSPAEACLQTLVTPVETTAGDMVMWGRRPDGVLHLLIRGFYWSWFTGCHWWTHG